MSSARRVIVLGSSNPGKLREARAALAGLPIELRGLADYPQARPPEETGRTFAENARLKATALARQLGAWVLADDSGLCVDALGGRPGVRSARYAGPDATDADKVAKLLDELRGVEDAQRTARFVCALALASPHGLLLEVEGACEGRILSEPRGCDGFGYDPVFLYPELGMTFAEIPLERKNSVSHRGRAIAALARRLPELLERQEADMSTHFVGIDLGGLNIKGGVVTREGKVLSFDSIPTEGQKGRDHVLDRIALLVERVIEQSGLPRTQIAGVGIGSPGPLSIARGLIYEAPNLPGWVNLPLAAEIQKRTHLPTVIENDANAAALAEAVAGAGKGLDCMIMLTLGTGIGGGIVLHGRVWHGADDIAAELGHVSICYAGRRCNCGTLGCVEAYASATAVVKRTHEALRQGARSSLAKGGKHDLAAVAKEDKCGHIFQVARKGDRLAKQIVADTIVYLATAIGSLINTFNPDMIVLFGGMTKAGSQLLVPLRKEVAKRCFKVGARRCKIVVSRLGGHAGTIGSALSALQLLGTQGA
ncbi:MAG TPA: XTP/dITP diphosphatase [Planctomycetota bacterium]|nr:XTP/dITP diphosphatase [Planctomycetota bacterium]HRR79343.1 XTP/dITP diphosphatase [Planctomycetota bacterium]HRT96186.1 XTP/dITP diphosphatase [Planctomycetota bacterium]